jgi:hypothetical protein
MRILVCGSRDYNNLQKVVEIMRRHGDENTIWMHGDAPGADACCKLAAKILGWEHNLDPYPAKWGKYPKTKNGKDPAGMIRNQVMGKKLDPAEDLVLAFWDGKSPGTKGMMKIARERGVEVKVYR